eukprot:74329-Pelagomonas_calceolata.AAC.5
MGCVQCCSSRAAPGNNEVNWAGPTSQPKSVSGKPEVAGAQPLQASGCPEAVKISCGQIWVEAEAGSRGALRHGRGEQRLSPSPSPSPCPCPCPICKCCCLQNWLGACFPVGDCDPDSFLTTQ